MFHIWRILFLMAGFWLFVGCNVPTEPPVTLAAPPTPVPDDGGGVATDDTPSAQPTLIPNTSTPDVTAEPIAPTEEPTATPPTPTVGPTAQPTAEPSILDSDPQDWDALMQWLFAARSGGMSSSDARLRLDAAGWMQDLSIFPGASIAQDFREVDLSGDGKPEWIVAVKIKDSAEMSTPRGPAYAGNAYIVADDAVVPYFADPDTEIVPEFTVAPSFLIGNIGDFTEDGIDDVIIESMSCGANRCAALYRLMSYHNGFLQDVSDERFSTAMTFPQLTVVPCQVGCQLMAEVSVWVGPNFGGARHVERWAWDGVQFAYGGAALDVPTERGELTQWIQTYRNSTLDFDAEIVPALLNSGWMTTYGGDFNSADLDGNGDADWILHIAEPGTGRIGGVGRAGDIWLVSSQGFFSFVSMLPSFDPDFDLLAFELLPDVTTDGLPDLLITVTQCGAHTCSQTYRLYTFHHGDWRNVVAAVDGDSFGEASSDVEVVDWGGQMSLQMHGGTIGSVGAGVMRAYTEVWTWDGTNIVLAETVLDETNWQHHLLYEANDLTNGGNAARIEAGVALYERVIVDQTLEIHAFFDEPNGITSYDANRQFAAFRLAYTLLRAGDTPTAQQWLGFLETNYPEAMVTSAAWAMFDQFAIDNDLNGACAAAQAALATAEQPLGALAYQGYGNPTLSSADLCQ